MNTTLPSGTLLGWSSQMALTPFYALQDLALQFLLPIAKILQHAETWYLSALDSPTHTIYRMFPPEDISDYTRVYAQVRALFWLAVLIFGHLCGYLGPYPPRKIDKLDNCHWLVRALYRGSRGVGYVVSYLRIPFVIGHLHAASDQFEADGDVYLVCLRHVALAVIIAM